MHSAYVTDSTDLGAKIRDVRLGLGENQSAFAKRFGKSQPTIHRWETNKDVPERHHWPLLANLSGLSVSDFVPGMDEGDDDAAAGGPEALQLSEADCLLVPVKLLRSLVAQAVQEADETADVSPADALLFADAVLLALAKRLGASSAARLVFAPGTILQAG